MNHANSIVGPACVLTHATAALSFVALQFSSSDLIRRFGEAGFVATITALAAVLVLMPLLGVLLLRDDRTFAAQVARSDFGVEALQRFCGFVADRMVRRLGLYSLAGLLVVAAVLKKQAGVGNVWSLETLRRWLIEAGQPGRRHPAAVWFGGTGRRSRLGPHS